MWKSILSRQQRRLIQRWMTPDQARRIAYAQQVKAGNVIEWTYTLTEKGKQYSELEPRTRALIRRSKTWTWNMADYKYEDWRAIKKRSKKIRF